MSSCREDSDTRADSLPSSNVSELFIYFYDGKRCCFWEKIINDSEIFNAPFILLLKHLLQLAANCDRSKNRARAADNASLCFTLYCRSVGVGTLHTPLNSSLCVKSSVYFYVWRSVWCVRMTLVIQLDLFHVIGMVTSLIIYPHTHTHAGAFHTPAFVSVCTTL